MKSAYAYGTLSTLLKPTTTLETAVTCPKSHSQQVAEPRSNSSSAYKIPDLHLPLPPLLSYGLVSPSVGHQSQDRAEPAHPRDDGVGSQVTLPGFQSRAVLLAK